ncbi:MAG: alpha/beta hydrolase family protein [Candidatus Eisenbacteria bacterium]
MAHIKGGRLEFLAPHLLRSQLLRPGFVRLSLRLGVAQQMPEWAKLQFTNFGVARADLDRVLGRIGSLGSWVDEWERLGHANEQRGAEALAGGRRSEAAERFVEASAAYNFAQYVMFLDIARKRALHESCVRSYASAAPLLDPPAEPFEVMFRRQPMRGYLRLPPGVRPAPVVVMINGTNAVKEELHWWSEALLERGIATLAFDGPGMGQTFHRLSMVAEPRPVGTAILDEIERRPSLDPAAVGFLGMSLGGYMAIRMAAHDRRVRAVACVSPPYSADIYWNVTLASMRRELAALYGMNEQEMGRSIERITLAHVLERVRCPLLVSGGGHDLITPGEEAWRIYRGARCERELVYYPRGAHDCFNVLGDLRPRVVRWLGARIAAHLTPPRVSATPGADGVGWAAAEAVDPDFGEALEGEAKPRSWQRSAPQSRAARFSWPWGQPGDTHPEVVVERAAAEPASVGLSPPEAPDAPDMLAV